MRLKVAEPELFERLLWPERFYNVLTAKNLLFQALFMPMGGPVHKAALHCLDVFREKGLYGFGGAHGHMLGTAFYDNTKLRYKIHGYDGPDHDNEIRNGIWATVLRQCRKWPNLRTEGPSLPKHDSEAKGEKKLLRRRTTQAVLHLQLWRPHSENEYRQVPVFCEDKASLKIIISIVASESLALFCAGLMGWHELNIWFPIYLAIPLFLKLASLPISVRREPAIKHLDTPKEDNLPKGLEDSVLFEISDYNHGFPLIEGPEPVVRQFFRHWGHPIRENGRDRAREVMGIALIFAFVLYFPAGLVAIIFASQNVQITWLSYQLYTIFAMHVMRIGGLGGKGRTEEGIAEALAKGRAVALKSAGGGIVMARLDSHPVERIRHGQAKVKELVDRHGEQILIRRRTTMDSITTPISPAPTFTTEKVSFSPIDKEIR